MGVSLTSRAGYNVDGRGDDGDRHEGHDDQRSEPGVGKGNHQRKNQTDAHFNQ